MNIYSYIQSPDIAAHCEKIGHTFNSLEMAVIINSCHRPTAEKHAGWREIIKEYPDMQVQVNDSDDKKCVSLHETLVAWIDYEEHLIEVFKNPEAGAIYKYDGWGGGLGSDRDRMFDNFETALSVAAKDYEPPCISGEFFEYAEFLESVEFFEGESCEFADSCNNRNLCWVPHVIRMTKSFINDDDDDCITAFFINDEKLDLVWIVGNNKQFELFPKANSLIFDNYVELPMPFKRGDILTYHKGWDKENNGTEFVLDSFGVVSLTDGEKYMEVRGYMVEDDGLLCDYSMRYHLEQLKYHREILEGTQRILHYTGLYLKDEIGLTQFLGMQHKIVLEHQLKSDWRLDRWGNSIPEHLLAENRMHECEEK